MRGFKGGRDGDKPCGEGLAHGVLRSTLASVELLKQNGPVTCICIRVYLLLSHTASGVQTAVVGLASGKR